MYLRHAGPGHRGEARAVDEGEAGLDEALLLGQQPLDCAPGLWVHARNLHQPRDHHQQADRQTLHHVIWILISEKAYYSSLTDNVSQFVHLSIKPTVTKSKLMRHRVTKTLRLYSFWTNLCLIEQRSVQ